MQGLVKTRPGPENSVGEGLREIGSDALHGVAFGRREVGDLIECDVGVVEGAGGDVIGAGEEKVDEVETPFLRLELLEPVAERPKSGGGGGNGHSRKGLLRRQGSYGGGSIIVKHCLVKIERKYGEEEKRDGKKERMRT